MKEVEVVIVYHSTRGHTATQAKSVFEGVKTVAGAKARLLTCEEATAQIDSLDAADAIVFGSPTLMGSMSSDMKRFTEIAIGKWFSASWKNKIAGAFTNSSSYSGDKMNTLLGLMVNAMQHGMIYVGLGMAPAPNCMESYSSLQGPPPEALNRVGSFMGPMATSFEVNAPDAPSSGDLETARLYGKRIAEVTLRFANGSDSLINDYVSPESKKHRHSKDQ